MAVERDCSNCRYHIQADPVNAFCFECLMTPELPKWEPDTATYMAAIEERHPEEEKGDWSSYMSGYEHGKQSRKESLIEASLNTLSGFLVSYFVWLLLVAPLFGIEGNPAQSFWITAMFTVVSAVRSYIWRRVFVNKFWRKVNASSCS